MNGASGFTGTIDKSIGSVKLNWAAIERPFFLPGFGQGGGSAMAAAG